MVQAATALFAKLQSDRRGVTALEYGIIAAAVVLAVIAGIAGLKGELQGIYTAITAGVTAAN
ncbi:Flp family type IVb pilin [Sabulicella rubraurantiaca]|uniref:Flp family type IVb pilin n=1 Tax=Sabulicella rubraurantiaca TaxID=2811429 RepID=UPI001A96C34F|nr:Flp family type IVb pilin [Sabulicella rubraurantiaca]